MTINTFVDGFLREHLTNASIRSVCDYGCGDGEFLKRNEPRFPAVERWAGVDFFTRFPEADRPKSAGRLRFVDRGSSEFDEWRHSQTNGKENFDLVVSMFSLHHFQYPIQELRHQWDLLAPGGHLAVIDFRFENASTAERIKNIAGFGDEMVLSLMGHYHRHHYTVAEAQDLFLSLPYVKIETKTMDVDLRPQERDEDSRDHVKHVNHRLSHIERINDPLVNGVVTTFLTGVNRLVEMWGIQNSSLFTAVLTKAG